MVADTDSARRWARWVVERRGPQVRRPATNVVLACIVALAVAGSLYLAEIVSREHAAAAIGIAGVTLLTGMAAGVARWMYAVLAGRVDIFGQALDASPDAQLIVDPDGRTTYANSAFGQLFPEADGGSPLARIAAALDGAEAVADFERLKQRASEGTRAIAALPLRRPRLGAAGWFNVAVNPIAGRPGYSFWHIQDSTAQHDMEVLIRDERNKLVEFLDDAPVGFYSVDATGHFLFANRTFAGWLDRTPTQIVGSDARLHDFLAAPPAEHAAPWDPFGGRGDAARGDGGRGDGGRDEVAFRSATGRVVHASVGQSIGGEGPDLRTRSVVRDLTPEREWEAALRLSRERFQRFFANAPIGIAVLDRFGRLEETNRALGELFGASSQDLIGEPLIGFVHDEDRREVAVKLAAAADRGGGPGFVEVRLRGARDRTCVVFMSRLDEAEGSDGSLMLHFIDATEQKNLEVQFAQSQKMQAVGQLAGGVAHDFNNLLTAMIGFCDLLLMRFRPGDPSFADIMQIKQNANRAANLVRQLLAFSRQQTLQPRIIDITDVLVELSHLLRRLIGENIELQVVHGRDLGLAKVDQGQFEQVIINLAVNARDAMPSGGTLTIRTASVSHATPTRRGHETMPAGNYILIQVADTGVGIPKENLARIFEPFFSTKEIGSGTGLGLSTVYGIVKQTGGFIFVDSATGRGAVFQIFLPRHQLTESAAPSRSDGDATVAASDLTGIGTIMLVEDEDPVRIFGARALRNKGYTVVEARNGEEALELMRDADSEFDLLITDVVMPRMDGPTLARHVRELHPDMKIVFISGYTEDSFRQRLGDDSDIHFLPKPFTLKQLASKAKEVISGAVD